jgi:deoxyribonuclease IV
MWRASLHAPADIELLRRARVLFDLFPLAIHASYLVNLASMDAAIRRRSIACFRAELARAAAIGAEYVVVHPGSYKGHTLESAMDAFAEGLRDAAQGFARDGLSVLLENTAGCGMQVGSRFEELRAIHDRTAAITDVRVGYCLDTCHLLAAGYDISRAAGLHKTIEEADRILGLTNVELMHANDSKMPLGSHVDRHANIGEGYIGKAGFRRLLSHPDLRAKPFILETPVDHPGDDRRNLENLKKLCPKSRTTITRLS